MTSRPSSFPELSPEAKAKMAADLSGVSAEPASNEQASTYMSLLEMAFNASETSYNASFKKIFGGASQEALIKQFFVENFPLSIKIVRVFGIPRNLPKEKIRNGNNRDFNRAPAGRSH